MGLQKIQPPALPVPPNEYDPQYLMQLIRIISIYFRQIASQAPIITNTANWSAVPTTTDIGFSDLPFNDMYRGATEDILRIKVDGVPYVPVATQAAVDQAEADAIAASNAFTTAGLALKVNKAGDTMTGPLNVPTVNATDVNATNVVSTTPGGIRAPGMILQVVRNEYTNNTSLGVNTWTTAAGSSTSFTPLYATSNILIMIETALYAAVGSSYAGFAHRITVDGTPIGFTPQFYEQYFAGSAITSTAFYDRPTKLGFVAAGSTATKTIAVQAGISSGGSGQVNIASVGVPLFSSAVTVFEIAA